MKSGALVSPPNLYPPCKEPYENYDSRDNKWNVNTSIRQYVNMFKPSTQFCVKNNFAWNSGKWKAYRGYN